MRLLRELRAAAGLLVPRHCAAAPAEAAAGLAWFPAVGATVGVGAALAGRAVGTLGDAAGAAAAVAVLSACWWRLRIATLGGWPLAIAGVVEAAAAASMPANARTIALLLAPVFACWAMVVQCYGGAPVDRTHPWGTLVGRARFREFGWASVAAFGCALGALDAVGLVVAIVAATVTLGARGWTYRTLRGMPARRVVLTGLVVEATVMLVLAAVVRLTT